MEKITWKQVMQEVYFEGYLDEQDAKRRENYLKTTQGRRFLGLK